MPRLVRRVRMDVAIILALISCLFASAVEAQSRELVIVEVGRDGRLRDPGRRHEGFFFRLSPSVFGVGGTLIDDSGRTGFRGGGIGLDLALGVNLVPNLILFGELTGMVAGLGFEFSDPIRDRRSTAATGGGVGLGLTGYISPSNVHLGASIGLAGIGFFTNEDDLDERIESRAGFYVKFVVGKEWWVSRRWALGLAGVLTFRRFRLDPDGFWVRGDGHVGIVTIGPAFTVTFD